MLRTASSRHVLTVVCTGAVLALAAACGSGSSSPSPAAGSGGSGGSSPTGGSTTGGGGGLGLSNSSFCNLAKKWKKQEPKQASVLTDLSAGPAGIKAFYTKLGSDYQGLIAVAPSDIKPSLQVLYSDFVKLNGVLAKYKYNLQKAAPSLEADAGLFSSPATKAAIAKLDAWGKANSCHL